MDLIDPQKLDPKNPNDLRWFRDVLTRCGRDHILVEGDDLWEIREAQTGKLVDSDINFTHLFLRAYDWEEDVPGYEGLLWRSPSRCAGEVCLKGTRVWASMVAFYVREGDDPKEFWNHISDDQIDAAVRYWKDRAL